MSEERPFAPQYDCDVDLKGFGFDDPNEGWLTHARKAARCSHLGTLGDYEIIEKIAGSGQSVVLRCRHSKSPGLLAIKCVGSQHGTTLATQRQLKRELEAASRLLHPNITVATQTGVIQGQVVLIMPWIDGMPITQWVLHRHNVGLSALLTLFAKTCEVIHHAHLHGIIHRDLKPSNILVDSADEPHILDFGMAKVDSNIGHISDPESNCVGSLLYAAPEQLENVRAPGGARTDIYSLGVILYEMLTRKMPYDVSGSLGEIVENIRFSQPSRLSTTLSLPRDLDTIISKALAKKPENRYVDAASFASDIRSVIAKKPVSTRKTPAWDVQRFAKQHRIGQGLVLLTFAILLSAAAIASYLAYSAREARNRAARARDIITKVNALLQETLVTAGGADDEQRLGAIEVLENAARSARTKLVDDKHLAGEVLRTVAKTYDKLWMLDRSEEHWREAVSMFRSASKRPTMELAESLQGLGLALSYAHRTEALTHLTEALAVYRVVLNVDDKRIAGCLTHLAYALHVSATQPQYQEAEQFFRESLSMFDRLGMNREMPYADTLHFYAAMLDKRGDTFDSLPIFQHALNLKRELHGEDGREYLLCRADYADTLMHAGEFEMAAAEYEEIVDATRRSLGDRWVIWPLARLGCIELELNNLIRAWDHYSEGLGIYLELLASHRPELRPQITPALDGMKASESAVTFQHLFQVLAELPLATEGDPVMAAALVRGIADVAHMSGNWRQASMLYEQVFRVLGSNTPDDRSWIADAESRYGESLAFLGRYDEAENFLLRSLDQLRDTLGYESFETVLAARRVEAFCDVREP